MGEAPEYPPLEVLLEEGPVLAVNKPGGLLTQGVPPGIPTLEAQVKAYLKKKYHKPGNVYLGIPHRLDRPVSGVVIFARNSKAAARLAEQFPDRKVRKVYWAVVERRPDPPAGTLTDWLLKLADQTRVEVVPEGTPGAKECTLRYRMLGGTEPAADEVDATNAAHPPLILGGVGGGQGHALLEIELGTGRMHQIRVQLASRGWTVVGDFAYGATAALLDSRLADPLQEPIALHARSLTFLHPVRYEPLTVTAQLPRNWVRLNIAHEGT